MYMCVYVHIYIYIYTYDVAMLLHTLALLLLGVKFQKQTKQTVKPHFQN